MLTGGVTAAAPGRWNTGTRPGNHIRQVGARSAPVAPWTRNSVQARPSRFAVRRGPAGPDLAAAMSVSMASLAADSDSTASGDAAKISRRAA